MKRFRHILLLSLAVFFITLTARPCGPDFPIAIFVLRNGPSGNYAKYAAGAIGVPQNAYRTRHLVVAYDYLSGHPLPPDVQKEAVGLNASFLDSGQADDSGTSRAGLAAWIAVRSSFGPVAGYIPDATLATDRSVPGQDYESFDNCLEDAFTNSAKTLKSRIAAYTAKDTAVTDWVRAQDAVFSNCGDTKANRNFGAAGNAPAPVLAPRLPAAAPANSPQWLKQDRAYQMAAASFYKLDLDDALTRFRAIAADSGSPWSVTGRYLVARTYIRKASIGDAELHLAPNDPHKQDAVAKFNATMMLAQRELLAMQSEPRMAPMRASINGLLDYVNLRLQPQQQAVVLATRLQSPNAATYRQAVVDLTWLHSSHDPGDTKAPLLNSAGHPGDMLAWIDAVSTQDEAGALMHWRGTRSVAWLVAALANAKQGDPSLPELLKAARSISSGDPGWLAVTYNRLRLSPQEAATRNEVLALLPRIRSSGDVSATNLFLVLSTATAPSLNDWLTTIPRTPAGDSSYEDGEEVLPIPTPASASDTMRGTQPAFVEDACGKKFPSNTLLPLFDTDAAVALNRDMPLRLLALAAESPTLPENLRFQVAQATWARAVLLDQPEIAKRMTPLLIACRPAWKPVLAAYDSSATPDMRHVNGMLALMRFPSTVPSVWEGEERRAGFATYDDLRENWWCTTVPRAGDTLDSDPDRTPPPGGSAETSSPGVKAPVSPVFLSQADLSQARTEVAALDRIPRASTYFAQQVLAWQKEHPRDPETPEILGEADRVLRNSCRRDPPFTVPASKPPDPKDMTLTANLARTLFETLQRNYPDSAWAKRYKSWQ